MSTEVDTKTDVDGKIEIVITDDGSGGADVNFSTNMSLPDMNYWLDHVKFLIISGQATVSS